jgi:hypothetical protein
MQIYKLTVTLATSQHRVVKQCEVIFEEYGNLIGCFRAIPILVFS